MSDQTPQSPDLAALVRTIAEAVLRQLGGGAGVAGAGVAGTASLEASAGADDRCLGWLLAAPLGHGQALLAEMALLDRLGRAQRLLCVPEAEAALAAAGGLAALGHARAVTLAGPGGGSAVLAEVAACDLLYVGALAWHQARALVALDDRDPCVAAVLEAVAAGHAVRVVTGAGLGGLHRFGPERLREGGALATEAARLWRGLAGLGITPVGLDALGGPLAARSAAEHSFTRAIGGLLTEKDVDQAKAEGRRELRLARATVVTPLARDRARALEVVIRRED